MIEATKFVAICHNSFRTLMLMICWVPKLEETEIRVFWFLSLLHGLVPGNKKMMWYFPPTFNEFSFLSLSLHINWGGEIESLSIEEILKVM